MIWVERGNPVTQNPETNTVLKAFRALDFRVVIEQFLTDTAREADIILPAKTMFEQSDVIGAYWHSYIQIKQKMIEPIGEAKPESEIYYELAQKLGFSEEEIKKNIPKSSDEDIEFYLKKKLEPFPGLTLDALKKGPILAPGSQEIAFSDFKFPTPSGKIELLSDEARERWETDALPVYTESEESTRSNSKVAQKYPLYFMTPNTKNRIHSQFNNLQMIRKLSPRPFVSINSEDAQNREIREEDTVKIYNDRGNLQVKAKLDFSIKPGCIAVTNGWWISEGGTVNFCSLGRETDMGHGAAFHDNLVEVEKVYF
jgi:anaerobic selenocysteine-containing dehydrogenase